jgi:hypothetical protein
LKRLVVSGIKRIGQIMIAMKRRFRRRAIR